MMRGSMKIFISYRRADSSQITGRIYDKLVGAFGSGNIFKDVDSIPLGSDFKQEIDKAIAQCDFLIAVIGTKWLSIADATGRRRLDDPSDLVRIEIERGLQQKMGVIPLFVDGAVMPGPKELPEPLKKLAFRNGAAIRPDPDFHRDMDRVIRAMKKAVEGKEPAVKAKKERGIDEEIRKYCDSAKSLHKDLPLIGFKTKLRTPILIKDIYVPLDAVIDFRATGDAYFADAEDAHECLERSGEGREISVPEAFKVCGRMERRGIVILGDPGSGKTTHLRRLMLWCIGGGMKKLGLPEDIIPVFLPLRELRDLKQGLDAFIQDQLDKPHLDTPEGFGKRLMKRQKLLLLLDGLDEVAEPGQRAQVSRWIDDALRAYPKNWFVVTSRFAGYTPEAHLSEAFLVMHIRPLTTEQAETFIRNWYRSVETGLSENRKQAEVIAGQRADDLIQRLKAPEFRSRRVFSMTRNPLLLTNLCLVHRDRSSLPNNRARLYEECMDVLLELWREAIGLRSSISAQDGRRVLQPAALWLHGEEERTRATAQELVPVMSPALRTVGWSHGTAEDFLRIVRDQSGLLTGWSGDQYGFIHLGFQEYLAAREIRRVYYSEDAEIIRRLAEQFGKGWWQEVILLMLSLREEPSIFVPFMREMLKLPVAEKHPDLMEMCLDETSESSAAPFVELLDRDPGSDEGLWRRQLLAMQILERIDEEALKSRFERLKEHPCQKIRKWIGQQTAKDIQEVIYSERGGYELVMIPAGTFMMGSEDGPDGEKPVHEVRLSGFYIGRYPVTNEVYGRFLAENRDMEEPKYWSDRRYNKPRQPVVGVSWHDVQKFAIWSGLQLPTEAQWEYACRAGTKTRYYTGDTESDLDRAGWHIHNSGMHLHSVGQKEPNSWGLYDMHGGIFEWCRDWYRKNYYKESPVHDPGGPDRGSQRVVRGGSWYYDGAAYCRSAYRSGSRPANQLNSLGFRLVKSIP